ncbi:MAG: dephospho-CoA kinase [bacterium]|nr:dephospho-CoA kinase [bacterium]
MKKVKIGLTGGIGAGKSTVANMLAKHGAAIVTGDELGRQVLDEDADVREALVERFGAQIASSDGILNRKALAALVFADPNQSKWLTLLTFPGIYSRWQNAFDQSKKSIVVFDAALIFEWNIQKDFDVIVVVAADAKLAYDRASVRFSKEDIERRIAAQLPVAYKVLNADFVFQNDGSLDDLAKQVEDLWKHKIKSLIA